MWGLVLVSWLLVFPRLSRGGGPGGIRTPYLLTASQTFSQLNYGPVDISNLTQIRLNWQGQSANPAPFLLNPQPFTLLHPPSSLIPHLSSFTPCLYRLCACLCFVYFSGAIVYMYILLTNHDVTHRDNGPAETGQGARRIFNR